MFPCLHFRSLACKGHPYRSWFCFFALLAMFSLIWWQFRMIETGSSLDYGRIRWIFSPPFYAFVVTASLSGGFLLASFYSNRVLRYAHLVVYGFLTPAILLWSNYRYFDFEGWVGYTYHELRSIAYTQNLFMILFVVALMNMAYHPIARLFAAKRVPIGACADPKTSPITVAPASMVNSCKRCSGNRQPYE